MTLEPAAYLSNSKGNSAAAEGKKVTSAADGEEGGPSLAPAAPATLPRAARDLGPAGSRRPGPHTPQPSGAWDPCPLGSCCLRGRGGVPWGFSQGDSAACWASEPLPGGSPHPSAGPAWGGSRLGWTVLSVFWSPSAARPTPLRPTQEPGSWPH